VAWTSARKVRAARLAAILALGTSAIGLLGAAAPSDVLVAAPQVRSDPAVLAAPSSAPRWTRDSARQLLDLIRGSAAEGLDPADYQPARIRQALARGEGVDLDAVADTAALSLAHDYYFGRVGDRSAMGWLIERSPYEAAQLTTGLQAALASGDLDRFFDGLLPSDVRYQALRKGLAEAADGPTRDRLRANLERARWMPRTSEANYLYVNVPSYRLAVMQGGQAASTYTVVVGAKATPTPQMISPTSSLVVNPWWNVPQSIVKSSNLRPGRGGYQFTSMGAGRWSVRQPPGPRNALGRLKFNLVNDQAIYLHDTPAKSGFARDARALSHGCIRIKDIEGLANELMGAEDTAQLDEALAGRNTATLRLPQTWPVYIVYFTADADPETGALVSYDDPYGYDARVIAALDGNKLQMASTPSADTVALASAEP